MRSKSYKYLVNCVVFVGIVNLFLQYLQNCKWYSSQTSNSSTWKKYIIRRQKKNLFKNAAMDLNQQLAVPLKQFCTLARHYKDMLDIMRKK